MSDQSTGMGGARRRKVPLLNGVAVLLVLVVVPVLLVSLRSHPAGHPARAVASGSPSAGPLTPVQYQAALDLFKNAVPSLAELANAHTDTAVSSASLEYNSALTDAETKMNLITPPAAVASAHHQLASVVDGLRLVVDSVVRTSICGGSSALSHIGSSPEAAQVRTAAKALAAADPAHPYTIVDFLPPATPDANRRLGTGTVIKKAGGRNVLEVTNQKKTDLVISLASPNSRSSVVMMYVQAGTTATASGIQDGNYNAYATTGSDWDAAAHSFTRGCFYRLVFTDVDMTSTSSQHSVITMTLNDESYDTTGGADQADEDAFPT